VLAHALPSRWLGRAWGILGTGWGIGEVVALLVMPSISNAGGYRAVFLTTAAVGLVLAIAVASQKAVRVLPSHPDLASLRPGLIAWADSTAAHAAMP
jgi:MFS family permease